MIVVNVRRDEADSLVEIVRIVLNVSIGIERNYHQAKVVDILAIFFIDHDLVHFNQMSVP